VSGGEGRNLFRKNPENFYKIFYGLTAPASAVLDFESTRGALGAARVKGGTGTQVL